MPSRPSERLDPTNLPARLAQAHTLRAASSQLTSDLAWFRTGAAHEELNGVLYASARRIEDAVQALGSAPALWHSWPAHSEFDIEATLRERGFSFVEEEPVMAVKLRDVLLPAREPAVQIQLVDDHVGLTTWAQVWTGHEISPGIITALAHAGLGVQRPVQHLLATLDGTAVGCAAVVINGDTVAIEHIVTAPTHRRQGIGTALTTAALRVGRSRGAKLAILTASPSGAAMYRRLGFVEQDRVRRFVAKP